MIVEGFKAEGFLACFLTPQKTLLLLYQQHVKLIFNTIMALSWYLLSTGITHHFVGNEIWVVCCAKEIDRWSCWD